jgi:alkaline phosphatase D
VTAVAPAPAPAPFRFAAGELGRWACLGAVAHDAARVWLRDPDARPTRALLRVAGEPVAEAWLRPDPAADGVAAADLRPARPRPGAAFTVEVAGLERAGRFAPPPGAPASLAFAFGSCHEPFLRAPDGALVAHAGAGVYPAMARACRASDVRFLLLLGDQVYSDGAPSMDLRADLAAAGRAPSDAGLLALYRRLYRGYFNEPGFRALLEAFPSYMTWDDHEIFDGWGSQLATGDLDRRLYRAAERAFVEYQHLHTAGSTPADRAPFTARFWHGDLGGFILDARSERSYAAGRVVGPAQWRALDAFLAEATDLGVATVFVVSSVPVVHFPPLVVSLLERTRHPIGDDVRDRWSTSAFRADREALLDRLFAWQAARPARQAILLSGDVHVGAAFSLADRRGPGLLHQWTSSALSTPTRLSHRLANRVGTALVGLGEHRVRARRRALVTGNNFGIVRAEPRPGGGHAVALTLHAYAPATGTTRPAGSARAA